MQIGILRFPLKSSLKKLKLPWNWELGYFAIHLFLHSYLITSSMLDDTTLFLEGCMLNAAEVGWKRAATQIVYNLHITLTNRKFHWSNFVFVLTEFCFAELDGNICFLVRVQGHKIYDFLYISHFDFIYLGF